MLIASSWNASLKNHFLMLICVKELWHRTFTMLTYIYSFLSNFIVFDISVLILNWHLNATFFREHHTISCDCMLDFERVCSWAKSDQTGSIFGSVTFVWTITTNTKQQFDYEVDFVFHINGSASSEVCRLNAIWTMEITNADSDKMKKRLQYYLDETNYWCSELRWQNVFFYFLFLNRNLWKCNLKTVFGHFWLDLKITYSDSFQLKCFSTIDRICLY